MKEIKNIIKDGKLSESLSRCAELLQDEPMNFDIRSIFVELLCINGELERADKQLDFMVQKKPEFAVGAVNLRHLIRAQQSRLDFYQGKGIPQLFHESDELDKLFLQMHVAQLKGDIAEAVEKSTKLESLRIKNQSDNPTSQIRDLDDSLNAYLEVLGTNGEFYLARYSEIENLTIKPAESFLETIWLRVDITIQNGPTGTAHLPAVYANSITDIEKLGQVTEWEEKNELFNLGKGLKMLYVNEEAIVFTELKITELETV